MKNRTFNFREIQTFSAAEACWRLRLKRRREPPTAAEDRLFRKCYRRVAPAPSPTESARPKIHAEVSGRSSPRSWRHPGNNPEFRSGQLFSPGLTEFLRSIHAVP